MNLVEVATWIQEADRNWHQLVFYIGTDRVKYIMHYVMQKGKGKFNPKQIEQLIEMEDSYDDGI